VRKVAALSQSLPRLAKQLAFVRTAALGLYIFIPALALSHVYLFRLLFPVHRARIRFRPANPSHRLQIHMLHSPVLHTPVTASAAKLTTKQLFRLFVTPMFTGVLSDVGICDRVEKRLRELQNSGKGYLAHAGKNPAYMTPDNLHTLPEMKELVEVIMEESAVVLDACGIRRDSHYITNMWANIASPNRRHNFHIHPNCLLSGIVYIKTPENCGRTIFASPRLNSKNIEPTYFQRNEFNADIFSLPPEKGRMMIWPSHVPHGVEEGAANEAEDRIVIAFNVMIRGLIDQVTARLDLG
jgi:uncharacterized protein (TIGR02466 family)